MSRCFVVDVLMAVMDKCRETGKEVVTDSEFDSIIESVKNSYKED